MPLFLGLWAAPMAALYLIPNLAVFFTEGIFFTKAAFVTFGGAYAVLAYIAQAGVEQYGWLSGVQMMDGLGLAETTPGPLIMVVQFVGFMAGWNFPGTLSPLGGAALGSLVATYFTFLPCFFFIFLGGPYIEKFRGAAGFPRLLSTITASVVGVVLDLAVWFGLHVLFPAGGGFDGFAAAHRVGGLRGAAKRQAGDVPIILLAGLAGLGRYFLL